MKKWRLQPGKMLLVDTEQGRIIDDDELKRTLATAKPYREWIDRSRIALDALPDPAPPQVSDVPLLDRQQVFGYTQEDLKIILAPMAENGEEAIGSMGQRRGASGAVEQAEGSLQLLQATIRAGHQSSDRSDPRGVGDVAGHVHRTAAESARDRRDRSADAPRGAKADPHCRGDGEDPSHRVCSPGRPSVRSSSTSATRRRGRGGHGGGSGESLRARGGRDPASVTTSSSFPIARHRRNCCRYPRCWRPRPCISTWSATVSAPARDWWSRRDRRAKSITSRCSRDTARRRFIPISRWRPSFTSTSGSRG